MSNKLTEKDYENILWCIDTTTNLVCVEGEKSDSLYETEMKIKKKLEMLKKTNS